jgi:competence protein ComEC
MKNIFQKYKQLIVGFFLLFIFLGGVFWGYLHLQKYYFSGKIRVVFFQIERGDATYIKTPHGKEVLIDAGQNLSILSQLEKYRPFYDRHIDTIVITHPDSDHYYGFLEVLKRFSVDNIVVTGVKKDDPKYLEVFEIAERKNISLIYADTTKDFEVDNVFFDILFPLNSLYLSEKNDNNTSLVIKMSYAGKSILLTGDLEEEMEEELLRAGVDVEADIVKAGHHGSKSSSSLPFIEAVSPEKVVYSVGTKNSFGHPHLEVVDRYKHFGVEEFYTQAGDVVFEW